MRTGRGLVLLLPLVCAAVSVAQERIDFRRDVLPILEQRCIECHRAPARDPRGRLRQPKAGLRLDGRGWIERGSDDNVVLVPGDAEGSLLIELVSLPADDDARMPARGEPLTQGQQDLLRRWVADGADFGDWRGAPGPDAEPAADADAAAPMPSRIARLRALAHGVAPATHAALERAAAAHAHVQPIEPGSPLLEVSCLGEEEQVTTATLRALRPIADRIVDLSLGATQLDDDALRALPRLPRLVTLRLHDTAIGDPGLAALRDLPELTVLDLHGTKVTDDGLPVLASLPHLERLYLWGSAVTEAGVERLRNALPRCRIHVRLELPQSP